MGEELAQARRELADRLRARRDETEQAALARIFAIFDPGDTDLAYLEGLRATVTVALDYAFDAIERGEARAPDPPPALLAQARMAARSGISLDVVLRRYLAGYALLSDRLIAEIESDGLSNGIVLRRVLRDQGATLDRLLAAVGEEYSREAASRTVSSDERRIERIERLLAGELLDTSVLAYCFEDHHVGLIAVGPQSAGAIRTLAGMLDMRLLLLRREEETSWAWLGSRHAVKLEEVEQLAASSWPEKSTLVLGEPAQGMAGWRLTHRQAAAALPIALREHKPLVRYADVALLAALLKENLALTSLRRLYLAPLEQERDGGETAKRTLRAYFAAGRNVSSTAAALGINRNTVTGRLRTIEDRIGRPLDTCLKDIEAIMQLDEIQGRCSLSNGPQNNDPGQ